MVQVARSYVSEADGFECCPCIAHAVGMSDEYPRIAWLGEWEFRGSSEIIEPGMIIGFESCVGRHGGHEGVKLENQVLVTERKHRKPYQLPLRGDAAGVKITNP